MNVEYYYAAKADKVIIREGEVTRLATDQIRNGYTTTLMHRVSHIVPGEFKV